MKKKITVGDYIEAIAYKQDGSFWFKTAEPQKVVEITDLGHGNLQYKMENGWCVHPWKGDYVSLAPEREKDPNNT